jgi:hypothetical protein
MAMGTDSKRSDLSLAPGGDTPRTHSTRSKVLAAALVVLVLLAAGVLVLVVQNKGESATPATEASSQEVVFDDFTRPDDPTSLGTASTGQVWEARTGTWGIVDNQAFLVAGRPGAARNFALVDMESANGTVSATASTVCRGWGLVFRYVGPYNWWAIQAQPDFSAYNVVKQLNGKETLVATFGYAKVRNGAEVRVEFDGPVMRFLADGEQLGVVQDSHAQNATSVGLVAEQACAGVGRWSDFRATATG